MPVLCEALSVVVRIDSIKKYLQGGVRNFIKNVGMEGDNLRMLERNEAAETSKEACSCKS